MNYGQRRGLAIAAAVVSAAAVAASTNEHSVLHFVLVPLATLLIVSMAFAAWRARRTAYALWVTIGLVCSLVGDVLLLQPERYFAMGLAAFLVAHIAYLMAFTLGVRFPARWTVWIACLLVAAGMCWRLLPGVPGGLRVPVVIYAVFLVSMAAQAMGRFVALRTHAALLAAIGGALFVVSDGLLAFNRFDRALPWAAVLILAPYFAAQWLIARSTDAGQQIGTGSL